MNKKDFGDLPDALRSCVDFRVDHRKIAIGIAYFMVGCLVLISAEFSEADALTYLLVVVGTCFLTAAFVRIVLRSNGLFLRASNNRVEVRDLYYPMSSHDLLQECINSGEWATLGKVPSSHTGLQLCMRTYVSEDGSFAAIQFHKYIPYVYVPYSAPIILSGPLARGAALVLDKL